MPTIQLFGGERDGTVLKLSAKVGRPDVYYAIPNADEALIKDAKEAAAKVEMRQKLSRIAYRFEKAVTKSGIGVEYQYVRCPELDKDEQHDDPPEEPVDQP